MADDEVVEPDEQEELAVAKPPKDTTKVFIIALVGLSILLMVLTPIVTIFLVKTMIPEVNTDEGPSANSDKKTFEYVISGVQCNLRGAQGTRYVRLNVALTYNNALMLPMFEEPPKPDAVVPGAPDSKRNRIMAELIKIISDKSVRDLESMDDKKKLATDIKESLNTLLKDDLVANKIEDGSIIEVYFPNFLIQ